MHETPLFAVIQQPAAPETPPAGGAPGQTQNPADPIFSIITWFVIPLVFLYLIVIRPAQRQEKQRKELLGKLKKNDEVVFGGGIIGKVVDIKEKPGGVAGMEDVVVVRVDDKTRMEVLRSAIARVDTGEAPSGDAKKDSK